MLRTLAVAALLALPLPVSGQIVRFGEVGGDHPLRTLCSSPTMEFCASWWAYEYSVRLTGTDPANGVVFTMHELRTVVQLSGSGYKTGSHIFEGLTLTEDFGDSMTFAALGVTNGGGIFLTQDASGMPFRGTFEEHVAKYTPSVYDIASIQFSRGSDQICSPRPGATNPCHDPASVPEPASMLLIATGFVGMATLRRRRQER